MLNIDVKKYASNPVIGLLPCILFVILRASYVQVEYALIAAFILTIVGETFLRTYYKSKGFSITFYMSGIALIITFIVWFLTNKYLTQTFTYVVVLEAVIVCLFMLLRASRTYIGAHFFRQKNLLQKALLSEFYDCAVLIQYGLTLHIFSMLLYRQFKIDAKNVELYDTLFFAVIPIFIVLSFGIYQALKVRALTSKLRKEEWLPIVTEKGEVTGKIAKNVSLNMKNKFLHPVVRVALVSNSKVYIQERPANEVLNPSKLDYPFEKYMLFSQEINLAARNSIRNMVGHNLDISLDFLLKHIFENENTKRLIFLFVANLEDEHAIKREGKMKGKFWTVKQLEEGFADEIFSECFELEFEYLKNMVLTPNDIFTDQTKVN